MIRTGGVVDQLDKHNSKSYHAFADVLICMSFLSRRLILYNLYIHIHYFLLCLLDISVTVLLLLLLLRFLFTSTKSSKYRPGSHLKPLRYEDTGF